MQPRGHAFAECRLTHDAVEHANRGNAHLHRREKLVGVAQQLQRCFGTLVARLGQSCQTRPLAAGQSQFGHGKHAIEHGQKDDQQKFHGTRMKMDTWHFT